MALSDAPSGEKYNVRRRGVNSAGKFWSDAQKIECVTMWLATGNLRLTAATLGIPEQTARQWRATQWWKEIAEEVQLQDRMVMSASAKKIIDKSLEVVADRLEQGDWIYDQKSGELRRKPVAMKDALAAATQMIDQKVKLDKVDVSDKSSEGIEQRLEKLMNKFAQLAQPVVTDVVFVENDSAKDEKREEGLFVRQTVRGEAGTGEESGVEESGTFDSSESGDSP